MPFIRPVVERDLRFLIKNEFMKTKNICIGFLIFSLAIVMLSGCKSSYIPHTVNTPLFTEKGELQLAVHASTGIDPQIAYSITDNLGVMANASFASFNKESEEKIWRFGSGEAALGYFKAFDSKGSWEVYAGGGWGKYELSGFDVLGDPYLDFNRMRLFVQPAIGTKSDLFEGSIAWRLSWVQLMESNRSASGLFSEPTLTAKIGNANFKGVFQIGACLPFKEGDLRFSHEIIFLSIGLQARFPNLKN